MIIRIDTTSPIPIYLQIRNQIILAIAKDILKEGEKIPSIRQLAEDTDINMLTVKKAYDVLKEEGYIEIDRRQGTKIKVKKEPDKVKYKLTSDLEILLYELILKGIEKNEILTYIQDTLFRNNKEELL